MAAGSILQTEVECSIPECDACIRSAKSCLVESDKNIAKSYCYRCDEKYCTHHLQTLHDLLHPHHVKCTIEEYKERMLKKNHHMCFKHEKQCHKTECIVCVSVLSQRKPKAGARAKKVAQKLSRPDAYKTSSSGGNGANQDSHGELSKRNEGSRDKSVDMPTGSVDKHTGSDAQRKRPTSNENFKINIQMPHQQEINDLKAQKCELENKITNVDNQIKEEWEKLNEAPTSQISQEEISATKTKIRDLEAEQDRLSREIVKCDSKIRELENKQTWTKDQIDYLQTPAGVQVREDYSDDTDDDLAAGYEEELHLLKNQITRVEGDLEQASLTIRGLTAQVKDLTEKFGAKEQMEISAAKKLMAYLSGKYAQVMRQKPSQSASVESEEIQQEESQREETQQAKSQQGTTTNVKQQVYAFLRVIQNELMDQGSLSEGELADTREQGN